MAAIGVSILQSPWFNYVDNALSDLGNLNHGSAIYFNVGLLVSGLIVIIYSLIGMRGHSPKTSYFLAFTGFSMQLVGLICENYGGIHFYVSVQLFIMLLISSMVYFWEKRDRLTMLVFLAVPLWVLHFQGMLVPGAAIPEMVSSVVVIPWSSGHQLSPIEGSSGGPQRVFSNGNFNAGTIRGAAT